MKVTFMEEIEARRAWRECMYCSKCNEGRYKIHHQLQPETSNAWWVECETCGFESPSAPTREIAITKWKQALYDR